MDDLRHLAPRLLYLSLREKCFWRVEFMWSQNFKKRAFVAFAAFSSLVAVSGCGATPGDNGPIGGGVNPQIPSPQQACIPLNAAMELRFVAHQAVYFEVDSFGRRGVIKAGVMPVDSFAFQFARETVGQVQLVGGGGAPVPAAVAGSASTYGVSPWNGSRIQINMNFLTQQPNFAVGNTPMEIQGSLSLQPQMLQYISSVVANRFFQTPGFGYAQVPGFNAPNVYPMPYGSPQGGSLDSSVCVSGLSFSLQRKPPYNDLGYGAVWLYINGRDEGIALAF